MVRVAACACVLMTSTVLGSTQIVFRAGVDLVSLGVTVTDRKGALVTGLTRDDFEVIEDGAAQRIDSFSAGLDATDADQELMAALHPALMLDTSASMEHELSLARTAAIKFLNLLPEPADITLVDFDTEVRVTRFPQRDFPRIVERIRNRKPEGWTALYDALGVYLDGASSQTGRPILVMYTDGADSRSSLSFRQAIELLKASHVTVYAIGLTRQGARGRLAARRTLQTMAETTGGQAFFPASLDDLDEFYGRILDEIRAQYQLGYVSTNRASDGQWRTIEVRMKRPDLRVRARKGYFARYKASRAP